jgi:signal transduction histidine kinase
LGYLYLLFGVGFFFQRLAKRGVNIKKHPLVYSLSLAVYCTAWTFYGSVGMAADNVYEYLCIYLGPTISIPLWWWVIRKMIRITKVQRLNTMSEFISARYGKNKLLGQFVSILFLMGIVPYIALQFKAIEQSIGVYSLAAGGPEPNGFGLQSVLIIGGLGLLILYFTTREMQSGSRNTGLVGTMAFESVIKLVAFVAVGVFVTFYVYSGFEDVFRELPEPGLMQVNAGNDYGTWFGLIFLSATAILFLPRQFEMAVIENTSEKQLNTAMWAFPAYMLIINVFVLPIAIAGNSILGSASELTDFYMVAIPVHLNSTTMATIAYLGGFAAATGMVIVSVHSLGKMLSNSVLMPVLINTAFVKKFFNNKEQAIPVFFRRAGILITLLLAYGYYILVAERTPLISIGLISFVAVSQFAPAMLGGLFWKRGTAKAAGLGMVVGFSVWFIHLVIPSVSGISFIPESILNLSIGYHATSSTEAVTRVLYWSLLLNAIMYVLVSVFDRQSSVERNQAEIFVDIFKYSKAYESSVVWKGIAHFPDVKSLLERFLGERKTKEAIAQYAALHQVNPESGSFADSKFVNYAEKLLTGVIGSASARIMVSNVAKEEEIRMRDVVDILQESRELLSLNRELTKKSDQLRRATDAIARANTALKKNDELKDEFLYTVTHEMRTPLTSIKALSEILIDHPDMDDETKAQYLQTVVNESDRMTRLISQVLDLENFEAGKHQLSMQEVSITELLKKAVDLRSRVFEAKGIVVEVDIQRSLGTMWVDEDRILQVLLNLLSNAEKHAPENNGKVSLTAYVIDGYLKVNVSDNGKGIKPELHKIIFEKFFQAKNQTIRKPKGSGLGLAISKKIIELHEGKIWVDSEPGKGSKFSFTIPYKKYI